MEKKTDRTEALRGVERQTLQLIAEVLTWDEWAKLLAVPLRGAVARGHRDLAQRLVRAGSGIENALHEAVGGGHIGIVNDLLEDGVSVKTVDACGRTPLHVAASKGQPDMVQLLLVKGADKDALDREAKTPLFLAVENDNLAAALALLAGGAGSLIRRCGWSAFHVAAQKGHVVILRAAIELGANVNAPTPAQLTALHAAARQNAVGAIDALVEAGANISARTVRAETPLHDATRFHSLGAANALLRHGADVNAQDDIGETPLHAAAGMVADGEALELVYVLLRSGADVNAQDDTGDTPLHNAAHKAGLDGASEVIDFLLRSGANEAITNNNGEKAVDVVGTEVQDEDGDDNVDRHRVRQLLESAPADRAWRRRGYLVLCRAHPDRLQLGQESTSELGDMARGSCSRNKLAMAEASGSKETSGGSLVGEGTGYGDWAGVVASVLGLQEEDVFRTIVEYL